MIMSLDCAGLVQNLPQLLLVAMLLLELPSRAAAIICYQCDATQTLHGNCPGWYRRPVDTFKDLHDKGGLYSHCVEIRLANGTIIHQESKSSSCRIANQKIKQANFPWHKSFRWLAILTSSLILCLGPVSGEPYVFQGFPGHLEGDPAKPVQAKALGALL